MWNISNLYMVVPVLVSLLHPASYNVPEKALEDELNTWALGVLSYLVGDRWIS